MRLCSLARGVAYLLDFLLSLPEGVERRRLAERLDVSGDERLAAVLAAVLEEALCEVGETAECVEHPKPVNSAGLDEPVS